MVLVAFLNIWLKVGILKFVLCVTLGSGRGSMKFLCRYCSVVFRCIMFGFC